MNNDLISREVLKKAIETYDKFAYLPDGKLCPFRDLEYSEMYVPYIHFDDVIKAIDNAPTVDLWEMRQEATENALKKAEVLYGRPQGECGKCDYYNLSQAFINGIVEIMSKNGITTVEELLETLKGGAE